MKNKTNLAEFNRYVDLLFIVTILIIISTLTINLKLKIFKDNVSTENRLSHKITRPDQQQLSNVNLMKKYVESFPASFDLYFSDNFSFRNRVIQDYSGLKYNLFNEGNRGAIKGGDGWLYGGIPDIDNHYDYCDKDFTNRLENYYSFFQSNTDYLKSKGAQYYIFVPPKKETVYPEYLPQNLKGHLCTTSRLDKLSDKLKQNNFQQFVDPKNDLIAAKSNKILFYKTDTHWNEDAAYIATNSLFKNIQKNNSDLRIPTLENFEIYKNPVNRMLCGDLTRFMSIPWYCEDQITFDSYLPASQKQIVYQTLDSNINMTEKYFGYETYFLPTAQKFRVVNPNALNKNKVLIFIDSFSWATVPFFTETFSEVDYIFIGDNICFENSIVDKIQPDIVIQEFLEKKL